MIAWRIAPATAETLDEVARLHALCFPDDTWDARDFVGILGMGGASGHLIHQGEESALAGFLFDVLSGSTGEIITLGVAPEMRRRGAARALIDDLLRRARTLGVSSLTLEVADDNEIALTLYASLGFQQVGLRPRYYRRVDGREIDAKLLHCSVPP